MQRFLFTAALLALVVGAIPLTHCATRSFNFVVANRFLNPDCVDRTVITVNGIYPGPTIDVNYGDDVVVTVVNQLYTEDTSVHFHGMFQNRTVWFDGAPHVSQCGIPPGSSMTYRFKAEPIGTHWWHSHTGLQKTEGMYGAIIVRGGDTYGEDEELPVILLNDWWHAAAKAQMTGLLGSAAFRWVGNPQSLLINGKGLANCSATTCVAGCEAAFQPVTWSVTAGRRYRLRLINAANLVMTNFAIEGHALTVVAADGFAVKPYTVTDLDINVGQRFDVLLTANQTGGNYWVAVYPRFRVGAPPTFGVLHYANASARLPTSPRPLPGAPLPLPDDATTAYAHVRQVRARQGPPGGVPAPNKKFLFISTQMRADGYILWGLNNITERMPATPYLHQLYFDKVAYNSILPAQPLVTWDYQRTQVEEGISINGVKGDSLIHLNYGDVVEVVIQNTPALNGVHEQHPWHLHGHHMYVMGFGQGNYKASVDDASFNTVDPPLQDTFSLLPRGWTAIRFVANNPGIWHFHCVIQAHLVLGMGLVFVVAPEMIPPPPEDIFLCGSDVALSDLVTECPTAPPPPPATGAAFVQYLPVGWAVFWGFMAAVLGFKAFF
eukprot:jgi/Mesvir1/10755/Mv13824-RA.1